MIIAAFPTLGKTHYSLSHDCVDFDYGFFRTCFGKRERLAENWYKTIGLSMSRSGIIVLTNNPFILPASVVYYPNYDVSELKKRLIQRGDDLNNRWTKDLVENFARYVNDWSSLPNSKAVKYLPSVLK